MRDDAFVLSFGGSLNRFQRVPEPVFRGVYGDWEAFGCKYFIICKYLQILQSAPAIKKQVPVEVRVSLSCSSSGLQMEILWQFTFFTMSTLFYNCVN